MILRLSHLQIRSQFVRFLEDLEVLDETDTPLLIILTFHIMWKTLPEISLSNPKFRRLSPIRREI